MWCLPYLSFFCSGGLWTVQSAGQGDLLSPLQRDTHPSLPTPAPKHFAGRAAHCMLPVKDLQEV